MLGLGSGDRGWRAAFIAGLILAPVAAMLAGYAVPVPHDAGELVGRSSAAGLLVGFGARLGGGCTSGTACAGSRGSPSARSPPP